MKIFFTILIVLLVSCNKDDLNDDLTVTDNKDAVGKIQLSTLFNIKEISDGYLITGTYNSKVTISKLDVNFNKVWSKNNYEWGTIISEGGWGGAFYTVEIVNVLQKENGNIIYFCSIEEGADVVDHSTLIVMLDKSGNEIFRKELEQYTVNAIMTNDKGYLLFGNSLIKLNSDFTESWKNNEHNYVFSGASAIQSNNNCIAVTGTWNSDQVLLKIINENGSTLWEKSNYNPKAFNDLGYDLYQFTNKDFMIIGRTRNIYEPWDINGFIIRTDNKGDTLWTKQIGGESNEWLEKFIYATDDDLIIKETIGFPNDSNRKAILLRITGNGEIIESKEISIFDSFLYTTSGYFLKAEQIGDDILLSKIQFQNLFD